MAIYRVRTRFTGLQGAPWLGTHFFDASASSAQQAVTASGAFWTAVSGSNMVNGMTWTTEADVATLNEATGIITTVTGTTPVVGSGTAVADALPLATQGLVRWRTGVFVAGREVRGRTFLPAMVEANSTGLMTTAYQTVVNNAASALISDVNTVFSVWARPFAGNLTATPPQPARSGSRATVTSGTVWNGFAVLRSRRD